MKYVVAFFTWPQKMYRWFTSWAHTPYAGVALFIHSFIESSFFPIPPDPLLITLCIGHPKKSFSFALNCTVASVLGALFGYYIGYALMETVGHWIIQHYHFEQNFSKVLGFYDKWGVLAVFIAALTPIPYKVFTIASGVLHMDLISFAAISFVGRGLRFFLWATPLFFYGPKIQPHVDKYFNYLIWIFGGLVVVGFVAMALLM